jgi:hypothetical protein
MASNKLCPEQQIEQFVTHGRWGPNHARNSCSSYGFYGLHSLVSSDSEATTKMWLSSLLGNHRRTSTYEGQAKQTHTCACTRMPHRNLTVERPKSFSERGSVHAIVSRTTLISSLCTRLEAVVPMETLDHLYCWRPSKINCIAFNPLRHDLLQRGRVFYDAFDVQTVEHRNFPGGIN